jgi:hypothetical protein
MRYLTHTVRTVTKGPLHKRRFALKTVGAVFQSIDVITAIDYAKETRIGANEGIFVFDSEADEVIACKTGRLFRPATEIEE